VGEIEYQFGPGDWATVNAHVTAHEMGHQFGITDVDADANHPAVWCHEGPNTDRCLMDCNQADADPTDDYSEFCYNDDPNSPNHIMYIRDKEDPI
jgi:hypothetical protein